MINKIKGILNELDKNIAYIDVNGIEFEIFISNKISIELESQINKQVKLFVYLKVQDDGFFLYGFNTKEEKEMFLMLLKVQGIGPKQAIKILDNSISKIISAILNLDISFFYSISGIGQKTAEKIILILKDNKKIKEFSPVINKVKSNNKIKIASDIIEALIAMGFDKKSAKQALDNIDQNLKEEDILKQAIIKLST